jgi:hypothetical protein
MSIIFLKVLSIAWKWGTETSLILIGLNLSEFLCQEDWMRRVMQCTDLLMVSEDADQDSPHVWSQEREVQHGCATYLQQTRECKCKFNRKTLEIYTSSQNHQLSSGILQYLQYCWYSWVEQEHCYRISKKREHLKQQKRGMIRRIKTMSG